MPNRQEPRHEEPRHEEPRHEEPRQIPAVGQPVFSAITKKPTPREASRREIAALIDLSEVMGELFDDVRMIRHMTEISRSPSAREDAFQDWDNLARDLGRCLLAIREMQENQIIDPLVFGAIYSRVKEIKNTWIATRQRDIRHIIDQEIDSERHRKSQGQPQYQGKGGVAIEEDIELDIESRYFQGYEDYGLPEDEKMFDRIIAMVKQLWIGV